MSPPCTIFRVHFCQFLVIPAKVEERYTPHHDVNVSLPPIFPLIPSMQTICFICVSGIALPQHWNPMPQPDMTVHLVQLVPGSSEYQDVVRKVQSTGGGINVQKIERVQNPHLYQSYLVRKQKMYQENPGGNNERQLFHGTQHSTIKAINTQGFNRSFCGRNGRHLSFKLDVEGR